MSITAAQVQSLLVLQVGDAPDNRLTNNVSLLWDQSAWASADYPPMQAVYTRLGLIDLAIGYYRAQVDTSIDGASMDYSQRIRTLLQMRSVAEAQIVAYQLMAQRSRTGVAASITQVTPELPPDLAPPPLVSMYPDRNDESLSGSPYGEQETGGMP